MNERSLGSFDLDPQELEQQQQDDDQQDQAPETYADVHGFPPSANSGDIPPDEPSEPTGIGLDFSQPRGYRCRPGRRECW
jgi:hypothetical protein